jgi:FkbM family methyltransferase
MEPHYRLERGYLWPADDTECAAVVFDTFDSDGMAAVKMCRQRRVVIQAGGNCGVWAMRFAMHFEEVHTFEPDPRNYHCLEYNTRGMPHIKTYNMGLAKSPGFVSMTREAGNCGAHQIDLDSDAERIPVTSIDMLEFRSPVDLIYLDIEGAEILALTGAMSTIDMYKPVVVFEDKGLSEKYGYKQGVTEIMMANNHNYKVVARRNRDVFMKYNDPAATL